MTSDGDRRCELCGDPIQPGEAWLVADGDLAAHSGCVYRDEDEPSRARWMPPESGD